MAKAATGRGAEGADGAPLELRRRPSQARSRRRVDRILRATGQLLEEGTELGRLSTAMIAERAGVPIGSVYQYFPNKDAVVLELFRDALSRVDARIGAVAAEGPASGPWTDDVARVVETSIAAFREEFGVVPLLRTFRASRLEEITEQSNQRTLQQVLSWLRERGGGVPPREAETIARVLITAFNAVQELVLFTEDAALAARLEAELTRLVTGYLAHYLES
jgi:AcrR family transcriptional regulator